MILDYRKVLATIPQKGSLNWIGLRSARRVEMQVVQSAEVNTENGLTGDRYTIADKRMITLIQEEHLAAIGSILGLGEAVSPLLTRRNLVVSGINLLSLKERQFRIGKEVLLEYTGPCHPCTRMEEYFGPGGLNAMRGHGGICVRVLQGGVIALGDSVTLYQKEEQ